MLENCLYESVQFDIITVDVLALSKVICGELKWVCKINKQSNGNNTIITRDLKQFINY